MILLPPASWLRKALCHPFQRRRLSLLVNPSLMRICPTRIRRNTHPNHRFDQCVASVNPYSATVVVVEKEFIHELAQQEGILFGAATTTSPCLTCPLPPPSQSPQSHQRKPVHVASVHHREMLVAALNRCMLTHVEKRLVPDCTNTPKIIMKLRKSHKCGRSTRVKSGQDPTSTQTASSSGQHLHATCTGTSTSTSEAPALGRV